ncbi:MAG: FAD-dependent oxidoreductase [Solirubrobacterales bacterium]|jgi:glycine/D-amino acid oxidase-like deaminating enzyme/nitrite reductase/ring-hydroxylating ferredoxin subunit|nr:FAD-dependent oxidoreductase [Solirubrobacterales bacterium]
MGAETIQGLPGTGVSLWLDGAEHPQRPPLKRDLEVDVAVIGGGIVGLTAALELQRGGAEVAVLEGRRVASGVSGNTTAKLSSLHGLSYDTITSTHGRDVAQIYGEANEWGVERVERLASELGIDCELRRKPNFTYTEDPARRGEIEAEAEAATAAGLSAAYVEKTDLPFEVAAAVRVERQAEFHPVKYLLGIAAALEKGGTSVFERTRAVGLTGARVRTEAGQAVLAERVIVATQLPFLDRGLFFARAYPMRSYATSVRVRTQPPLGMYLQAEQPGRSLRAARWNDEELLIVGGESHVLGRGDPVRRFKALERYARERFDVAGFEHRWSAHDYMPEDGLPYIGRAWPFSHRVLTATGMRKWGLAMGTAAARMLADEALGREHPWTASFDPWRIPPVGSAPELLKHNADAGLHFFADRVKRGGVAGLAPGEGRVIGDGLGQTAVHRDDAGRLHAVSARCTHLGCIVRWNDAERTWDCPCHGSRFETGGAVLTGPAVHPLQPKRPPTDD